MAPNKSKRLIIVNSKTSMVELSSLLGMTIARMDYLLRKKNIVVNLGESTVGGVYGLLPVLQMLGSTRRFSVRLDYTMPEVCDIDRGTIEVATNVTYAELAEACNISTHTLRALLGPAYARQHTEVSWIDANLFQFRALQAGLKTKYGYTLKVASIPDQATLSAPKLTPLAVQYTMRWGELLHSLGLHFNAGNAEVELLKGSPVWDRDPTHMAAIKQYLAAKGYDLCYKITGGSSWLAFSKKMGFTLAQFNEVSGDNKITSAELKVLPDFHTNPFFITALHKLGYAVAAYPNQRV